MVAIQKYIFVFFLNDNDYNDSRQTNLVTSYSNYRSSKSAVEKKKKHRLMGFLYTHNNVDECILVSKCYLLVSIHNRAKINIQMHM